MFDRSNLILPRLVRFLRDRGNRAVHGAEVAVHIEAWDAPGEPVPFSEAVVQQFEEFTIGAPWGKPWGTTWFHVTGTVPAHWDIPSSDRVELVVDLGFIDGIPGFQAEALIWTADGDVISAIEPLNRAVTLGVEPGQCIELYIEAASNPDIARGFSFEQTPFAEQPVVPGEPLYRLRRVAIAHWKRQVWEFLQDLAVLAGLAGQLPDSSPRRAEILYAIDAALDLIDPQDVGGTVGSARGPLLEALAHPAHASAHRIHAVGHAHIDSAWLWPIRETRRKVARTFSNVLRLLEENADFTFSASSAQQYAWLKQDYPALFARVKQRVAEGRFVPIGGQWIEPDSNLPSGESLARQFLQGKQFFLEEFGIEPTEVWIPDSFGYSGALPQIAAAAGSRYFLTQKLSWNDTNSFPHHTFYWEGIDGTRILTHFPPADTYNSMVSAEELHRAERQFREKGKSNTSLLPFGWGDGGGGPTREMLAAVERTHDLEGSPRVKFSDAHTFFAEAETEYEHPPVWVGELYLEAHRGVATTQVQLKQDNRRSETLLREAEYWCSYASVMRGAAYPAVQLQALWREVLLLQFHDILPGSSITWVHREAAESYSRIHAGLEAIIDKAARELLGEGTQSTQLNTGPYAINEVAPFAAGHVANTGAPARVSTVSDLKILDNGLLRVTVDADGGITSMMDLSAGRELIPSRATGALLQLFHDVPTQWDAWDLDESYRRGGEDILSADSVDADEDRGAVVVRVRRTFYSSSVTLEYRLETGRSALDVTVDLDWHEDQKILKLAFPIAVHATRAASEIQYGHLYRDIHTNTSWDAARFETVAHRWLHVGEPNYGVAFANSGTYGYDITRDVVVGESRVTVRASLARAPMFPDSTSDRGSHHYRFSLCAGASIPDAVREGYRLSSPLRHVDGVSRQTLPPLIGVDNPAVIIEAVKLAEDGSGDLVVRLYEAFGTTVETQLQLGFAHGGVIETDLLERHVSSVALQGNYGLRMRPFQLLTLRFAIPRAGSGNVG